jgi:glycosyltransferase involved in cell wall biosynthesis
MNSALRDMHAQQVEVSIVAPCYNEEQGLPQFVERMIAAAEACATSFELILINDGSRDRTWACIQAMAERYPAVVGVNLSRNHGHQMAVTAGLSLVRGARVMVIDADLQDPPELLSAMMARMDEGFDVVYGRRKSRPNESRFKLATASMFYRVLGRLSEVEIPTDTGDFRLMSRRIVDRLNAMPEQDRFLRGMVAWLGGAQTELLYDRDARYAGETGYTLAKMLRLAVDGLAGFSRAPLRLAVVFASVGMVLAAMVIVYALIGFITGKVIPGWTSLALIMLFFGIAQLGCLAIIGAYLGRVYMQVKGRPLFLINQIVGSAPQVAPPQHSEADRAPFVTR